MKGRPRTQGMTLVELLTTVAVVAILSTVAVASYRNYVMRANRADATSTLLRIQVAEEKYYLQHNTYTTDLADAPPSGLGIGSSTLNGYYSLAVTPDTATDSANTIETSYLATATATGGQAADTSCATLAINDQGQRQSSPSAAARCWR